MNWADKVFGTDRLHRATVSRSREKAPINPIFGISVQRETAGQAPVPYAREAPASVSMVAGEPVNLRAAINEPNSYPAMGHPLPPSQLCRGCSYCPLDGPACRRSAARPSPVAQLDEQAWV